MRSSNEWREKVGQKFMRIEILKLPDGIETEEGICTDEDCGGKLVKIDSQPMWRFDEDGEIDEFVYEEHKCLKCGKIYCVEIHKDLIILDSVLLGGKSNGKDS